jgi:plasmid stabilization system protein ParE
MVKRAVVWTLTASKQRREILKFWVEKNGSTSYSERLIVLIRVRVNIISKNPYSFRKTNFKDVCISSLGHFSLLYRITDKELIIVGFWDNRQDSKKMLELLKS